jgi:hypothetical protein
MTDHESDLIERIAEAAFKAMVPAEGVTFANIAERSREVFRTQARAIIEAIGLTPEWSDDIAGPEWCRYTRWVTKWVTHRGPRYHEADKRAAEAGKQAGSIFNAGILAAPTTEES